MWCCGNQQEESEQEEPTMESLSNSDPGSERRASKMIEKQIRKDKKAYRSTQRLQLVGLDGSGKTTLIRQMKLLHNNELMSDRKQAKARDLIRTNIQKAVILILKSAPGDHLNETRTKLLAYEDTDKVDEAFYTMASEVWADSTIKEFVKHVEVRGGYEVLNNIDYFLDRMAAIAKADYIPSRMDVLKSYTPTTGIFETQIQIEQTVFSLHEVNCGQTGSRWTQYSQDVTAVIFVADASSYDVIINPAKGLTLLHETLIYFHSLWNDPNLKQKSVILFLNKQDCLEKKIKSKRSHLSWFFPEFSKYKLPPNIVTELDHPKNVEYFGAKYFIRDCFLQIAQEDCNMSHQCYSHFTSAIDTDNIGKLLTNCCRDIVQRVHLRMHEIL
ncbi:hypothetical protein TCAL_04094 [Tigriopus californicus]|uniref:Adenylate cyclase-stimulating G alpha protein n=1 Tax=Tigriopus californicus TaxID=6832 RepID=A0A553NUJ9_TIGCA|nr:guanine nucleotide-binding protein G(s) subunit alpha-like [Tigriopus californicus]TRY69096.1 hypothetical protein TCAL_04094 [Tigriopus californicus]|eukprot:TCALIF_04094-PA protein Name:"Similar to G-s-alpha-60A Guanine nucleotide-binding protein G(s) subunit alpha (Anopheles gambiae)" AED:0.15 eAED:0.15 QI:0/-1/0/1/-1/1/1/0/384